MTGPVEGSGAMEPMRSSDQRSSVRICPACGYKGEGVRYFQRSAHAVLLAGATLFTYGIGGLIYWGIKRHSRICPACGSGWERAAPWPGGGAVPVASEESVPPGGRAGGQGRSAAGDGDLPRGGVIRRFIGVTLMLLAVFLVGVGIVEGDIGAFLTSGLLGLGGAASFAWGWRSLQRRREGLLHVMQRRALQVARRRGGRLTATELASELDLSLAGAERVLLSMDDGFRVRSDVTDEGLLIFEFPEILLRELPGGGEDTRTDA